VATHLQIRAQHAAEVAAWYASSKTTPKPTPLAEKLAAARGERLGAEYAARNSTDGEAPCDDRPTIPAPPPAEAIRPRTVFVASDIHWNSEGPSWRAIRKFHRHIKPDETVLLGDMFDAACVGKHDPSKDDPQHLVDEIERMVKEANALRAECGGLVLCIGNHDKRVESYLRGPRPWVTKGIKGLTLPEIARAHGMRHDIDWFVETAEEPHLWRGQFALDHGHNSMGRFGGGMHLAANAIARSNGASRLRGHAHRAQMWCRSGFGKTAIGIANPAAAKPMDYAPGADWQFGMTLLVLRPPAFDWATPYVIVCDEDGGFSWGDRYFSGDAEAA
jgi:hypothetical protein